MAEPLVDWVAELKAEGADAVRAALADLKKQFEGLDTSARQWGGAFKEAATSAATAARLVPQGLAYLGGKLAEAAKTTTDQYRTLSSAFESSSRTLLSWVRAGMQGTAEGEQLGIQMQALSRQVASIFAPAIRVVVDTVTDLVGRFRALSGNQQEQIARFVGIGAAALGVVVILPRLVAGIQSVSTVLRVLAFSNPFTAILAGVSALMAGTEEGRKAFGDLFDAVKPVMDAIGSVLKPLVPIIVQIANALSQILGPAFKVLGPIIEAALLPLKLLAKGMEWLTAGASFRTTRGGMRLAEIADPEARQREIEERRGGIEGIRSGRTPLGEVERSASGAQTTGAFLTQFNPLMRAFGLDRENYLRQITSASQEQRLRTEIDEANRRRRHDLTPRGGGAEDLLTIHHRLQAAVNRVSPELTEARRHTSILVSMDSHLARLAGRPTPTAAAPAVGA